MSESEFLAEQFEENRDHLRAVAYRMLGSAVEADDAVQEAWLRLSRTGAAEIDNLGGWLTTVVARVCLDMLRSRASRREDALDEQSPEKQIRHNSPANPEQEALLADSVGLALMVVLDRLAPAERLAFVLHDLFDLSFEEIASIVDRTPAAARQLASRARRRVRCGSASKPGLSQHRKLVEAFLAAMRAGDVAALISVLDPNVVIRTDKFAAVPGLPLEMRGVEPWARQAMKAAQGARAARTAVINGEVGLIVAPRGHLFRVLRFTIANDKISQIEVVGDPAQLGNLEVALLEEA
jgi:RNA polymerase sigma-70 factor (ECF subfamily)